MKNILNNINVIDMIEEYHYGINDNNKDQFKYTLLPHLVILKGDVEYLKYIMNKYRLTNESIKLDKLNMKSISVVGIESNSSANYKYTINDLSYCSGNFEMINYYNLII